ncbi:MAG: PDZ domain-containing protein [Bacteroidales bacterium]|nr:PDZ domain-containing protein [Bacteroidales bacterium]
MKRLFYALLLLVACVANGQADEARLLRFPTTNGQDVVFTYAGDLYKAPLAGGEARRLTSHVGVEIFARFSPDGSQIAFTGQYDGNTEVYVMPAKGGEPRRLTYTSTNSRDDMGDRMGPNNMTLTWTPDGKQVVYRNRIGDGFEGKLWKASLMGGMPEEIPLPEGGFCSYSPDGKLFAYNRVMREFRTWKYYKGGMADEIWLYNPARKTVENLTNNVSQDIMPMWVGDEIFFISDRDMTMNIFVYNTKTQTTEKVTNYTDYDVKFPSCNGKLIVYEHGGYLYWLDPTTRKTEQIHITLNADNIYAREEFKHVSANSGDYSLSVSGKRLFVAARGEVFDVPVERGVTKNITRTSGANERCVVVSPDGKSVAYISDRTGETEVWLQPVAGGEPKQLTRDNDTYIRSIYWLPNSKKILYTDRKNRVVEVEVESRKKQTLLQNPEGEFYRLDFSADSRWMTYTKSGKNEMAVVYVFNLDTHKEFPVTEKWYHSSSPTFSSDGRYLVFSSERDLNPQYGSLEWNHVYTRMGGVYMAMLAKDTPSPLLPVTETVKTDVASGKGGAAKKADAGKDSLKVVAIDPEGIESRIVKLPLPVGSYYNFYCDGAKVWYSSGRGTSCFDLKSQEQEQVADATMTVPMGGKKALFVKYGAGEQKVYVCDIPHGKARLDKTVDLSRLTATVNYGEEWNQIFNEVWRAYRDGFYLENMHGRDWKAIREKYAVLLPYVKSRLDLNYVIGEMISELSCGHAYVSPGEKPEARRVVMGLLGAELKADKSGFFQVTKILQGAPYSKSLRSPLAEPGINVKVGDYITAVDGIPANTVPNIYQLLVGKADVLTELSVNSKPSAEGAHTVVVSPIADEYPLYHYEWVQGNIKTVEKATNGRVGYVYIPDMGVEGLNEFARYYYPQLDKEALIVDDRANGGGNVSPMIIDRLLRKPYRMTMSRTSTRTNTVPDGTLVGPKVLLINKYSASDGDLFPWSFKANGMGTVIGTRTWGGIIGISGSLPYIDGTDVRVPFFTNYDVKTGQWIVENHGVDPDILIDNDPVKEQQGIDQQLNKAIEVILEQLKERKPLPPVPAPRTMKDLGW